MLSRALARGFILGTILLAEGAQAQWQVSLAIKQTDGRWQDTLLAGDTNILQITIANPVPVAAYTIPLIVTSQSYSAFARLLDSSLVSYVGRMADSTVFSERIINQLRVNGTHPDSILYGALAYTSNFLPAGSGVVIEHPLAVAPYVGSVRIDTGLIPPASNRLAFTDSLANEITAVSFNSSPVFPVVLRVPNAGPSCTPPADFSTPYGTPLSRIVAASDPEGNALTFRQVSGPGSTTGAGVWTWTPGCAQVGIHSVCITISDPNHLDWDTCCFAVTVTQAPPALTCQDQITHPGDTVSYQIPATDDGCAAPLNFALVSGPGSIHPATGLYTYSPQCADVGVYQVNLRVHDGRDTTLCQFQVDVVNAPPVIDCPQDFARMVGRPIDFLITAADPDLDTLVFSLLSFQKLSGPTPGGPNSPPSLTSTGRFVWSTTSTDDDDYGQWEVRLRVSEACDSALCTFQIEITPNQKPVCAAPGDLSMHWSSGSAQANFAFSDPDGDTLQASQISGPGSITAGGLWTWSFGCADTGSYQICAVVTDADHPAGDTCCFDFTVYQTAPVLTCHDDSAHVGDGPLAIQLAAQDDGCPGNPLRFHLLSGPGAIDSLSGLYTLSPAGAGFACNELGQFLVTAEVTDGVLADTCSFSARVYNNPPQFVCPPAGDTLRHPGNRLFEYDSGLFDPDGDALAAAVIESFTKLAGPPGGPNNTPTVTPAGAVTWQTDTTNNNDFGLWRMVLESGDQCGTVRCSLLIGVQHNSAPFCAVSNVVGLIEDTLQATVQITDLDLDTVTIQQISGPGALSPGAFNAATWSWVALCADTGVHQVCIVVSDPVHPQADTCCFDVTVFENAPVILCAPQTTHYGQTLVYDVPYEDDLCPQAATWSRLAGPGSIQAATGRYTLPTTCAQVGTHSVTVRLFDGQRADTCSFDVDVTNTMPFVNCPADLSGLVVGSAVDLDIEFGDADLDLTTMSLVSFQKLGGQNANPPNHAPVLSAAGQFHWDTDAVNANDAATWLVTVRASEACGSSTCSFRIEVLPNEAPVCTAPLNVEGFCDAPLSAGFQAVDADGDSVTFAWISGPGAVLPSGEWSWTATCAQAGVYDVCASLSDSLHPSVDTCCFTVSVCGITERGDVNGNHLATSEDIILLVNFVFKGGLLPLGHYTADMNCDGTPTSADIIKLVNYIFKAGALPCDPCSSPLFPPP